MAPTDRISARETQLRNLFATMRLGVVYQNRDGTILEANPAACRILGLTLDELLGRSSLDPRWRALREDGAPFPGEQHPAMQALRTGAPVRDVVMGVFDPRREETRWILVSAVPEFRDGESDPFQAFTTFSDITELRRSADALRASEESLRSILDSSPMGMHLYRLDDDGRLVFTGANPAADAMLGVDNRQYIGKTVEEAFPPLADTEIPDRYRQVCVDGEPWHTEQVDYEDKVIRGAFEVHAFRTGPSAMAVMFLDITERKRMEQALRKSEASYREIFDSTTDAIVLHDADTGAILDVNRSMLEMFGYTRDEAVGLDIATLSAGTPPYTQEEAARRIRQAVEEGDQVFEWRARRRTGERFWVEVALRSTEIGGEGRVLAVVRDISTRREVQEALLHRSRFESLVSEISARFINLPAPAVDENIETSLREISEFIGADAGYLFRFSEDWASLSLTHLWQNDRPRIDRERLQDLEVERLPWWTGQLAREEVVAVSKAAHLPDHPVVEHRTIEGPGIGALVDVPLVYQGRMVGFLGFDSVEEGRIWSRDEIALLRMVGQVFTIAQQRSLTEAALHASEQRHRALFESAGEAILLLRDLVFIECNPKAEEVFGRPREEIVGNGPLELSPAWQRDGRDSREKARNLMRHALEGEVVAFEWLHDRPDGSTFDAEVTLNTLEIAGESLLMAHVRDITEHKQLEERLAQAQKMETVGQLAGGIAHDFNNLLAPILGYAELLLLELPVGDPRHGELDQIRRAGERARTLTRQLLAFSHKQVLEMKVVDLCAVVSDCREMLRRTIREDIKMRMATSPGPCIVLADPHQIEQVLVNLAVNARDAMAGPGTLTIETRPVDLDRSFLESHPDLPPGDHVLLSVSDTGTGMDEPTLQHIFEPFFTTKATGQGTGLGLATVYGIVKQHRGIVLARSRPGEGSRFDIYFPRARGEADSTDTPVEPGGAGTGTETIVVVEDDEMVRTLACKVLRSQGYQVAEARSARACFELLASGELQVDLLLTDVVMPEMNGRELYEQVARARPGLRVLYMSGYTDDVIASHGVLQEGVHLIQKPFSVDDLARKVRDVLEG
jgi:PAS domain S-box-containing protein